MFSTLCKTNFNFLATFNLSSANPFNFDQSKNLSFGKELKFFCGQMDKQSNEQMLFNLGKSRILSITYYQNLDLSKFKSFNPLPNDKFLD